MEIRTLKNTEIKILEQLLYEAIFIPEGIEKPSFDIIKTPELQVYINNFGNKIDDYCLVAEDDDEKIIGGVWVRIISGEITGFGYVDDETPEFAISLFEKYRNQGIGTKLMLAMIDYLRNKKYKQCSLAVQKANYAVKMYKNIGFQIIKEKEEEFLMLLELGNFKTNLRLSAY
jgi:ribosomal protein S18 acetylase RimI-like enzyme